MASFDQPQRSEAAPSWNGFRVATFAGQHDSHIDSGEDYRTIDLASIFEGKPQSKQKMAGNAFLASGYCSYDARSHQAQREHGSFVVLVGDIDKGDLSIDTIKAATERFADGSAWFVYSSAHSRDGDRRWRVVLPLSAPIAFAEWFDAQTAFFTFLESAGIPMDHALSRAGQPVYLPNVPYAYKDGTPLRGADGEPIYYQSDSSGLDVPGLDITRGIVASGIASIKQKRAADDREREFVRRAAADRHASRPRADGANIIETFNASTSLATMLDACGYEQSPRSPEDWRSPMQTGDTYATRIIEGKWVSLSASDAAAGVGSAHLAGCYGDAYDLYVHFKHGGDHKSAYRELGREQRGHNVLQGNFRADGGDPGWQEMPDWVHQGGSEPDYEAQAMLRQSTPDIDHGADSMAIPDPARVVATPYAWRDPATIKPREWVYGRSIQRGHVRAILAPGAAGKTILSVGEALAMATGRNLLGQEVPGGPKRVWLWNLEDDAEELARIIQAACKHWSIGPEHIRDHLFVDSALEGATLKLATSTVSAGLVINRPLVAALTDEMLGREIDYLHVDPFVSSHAANENDNMEIDTIAKEWAMVAKNAKAGVGLAHHVSKAGAAEVTALSGRGAVSLINACRSVMVLNRMSEEEARMWGIEDERRRRFFRVYDDKNNRAPPSDKSDWYTMASVSLGNGANDDGDNMGVVIPWSPPDAFENVTAGDLLAIQQQVASRTEANRFRADVQASAWVGKVVADHLGLSAESSVKADRAKINKLLGTWFATGALIKVEGKDSKSNDRTFVEVGTWALQDVPPTSTGEVGAGREGEGPTRPHPTCPPTGAGVGTGGPLAEIGGGENLGGGGFVEGNPALGPAPRDMTRTVF
jgi:hypothetical protein